MFLLLILFALAVSNTTGYHAARFAGKSSTLTLAGSQSYGLASRVVRRTKGFSGKAPESPWSPNTMREEMDYPSTSPKKFGLASRVLKPVQQAESTPKLSTPASVNTLKQKTVAVQGKSQQKFGFAARVTKSNTVPSRSSFSAPSPAPTFMDTSSSRSTTQQASNKMSFGLSARVKRPGFVSQSRPASYSSIPSTSTSSPYKAPTSSISRVVATPAGKKNYGLSARINKGRGSVTSFGAKSYQEPGPIQEHSTKVSSYAPPTQQAGRKYGLSARVKKTNQSTPSRRVISISSPKSPVSAARPASSPSSRQVNSGKKSYGLASRVQKPTNTFQQPAVQRTISVVTSNDVSVSDRDTLKQRVNEVKGSQKKYGIASRVMSGPALAGARR